MHKDGMKVAIAATKARMESEAQARAAKPPAISAPTPPIKTPEDSTVMAVDVEPEGRVAIHVRPSEKAKIPVKPSVIIEEHETSEASSESSVIMESDRDGEETLESMRRRVAKQKAKVKKDLDAFIAEKARRERANRDAEARDRERERQDSGERAAAATAAAMEKAHAKLDMAKTPGMSRVDTLRKLFEGETGATKKKFNLDVEDSRSSNGLDSSHPPRRSRKGKTPQRRTRRFLEGSRNDSESFVTCSNGDSRDRRERREQATPMDCSVKVAAPGGGGGGGTPPDFDGGDPPPPY